MVTRRLVRTALALGLLAAAGCVERTPGHASGYIGGDAAVFEPPPEADGGADASDAEASDAGGDAAAWTGSWSFVSGSEGLACDGSLSVIAVSGSLSISPGTQGAALSVSEDGCTFEFDLAGDVASSRSGQSCSAWAVPTIPMWTLTMQPDGTLHELISGRVYMNGEVCTISGTSILTHE